VLLPRRVTLVNVLLQQQLRRRVVLEDVLPPLLLLRRVLLKETVCLPLLISNCLSTQPRALLIFLRPLRTEENIYSCTAGRPRPLRYVQHQRPPMRQSSFTRSHSCTFVSDTVLFSSFNPLFCLNKQRPFILSTSLLLCFRLLYLISDAVSSSFFSP
jgi:hypothetical protein